MHTHIFSYRCIISFFSDLARVCDTFATLFINFSRARDNYVKIILTLLSRAQVKSSENGCQKCHTGSPTSGFNIIFYGLKQSVVAFQAFRPIGYRDVTEQLIKDVSELSEVYLSTFLNRW